MSKLKRVKVSEVIRSLQHMQNTYGDLLINLSTNRQQDVSECIYFRYEQFDDHDEISISDFAY